MNHATAYELSTVLHDLHRSYGLEDFLGFHAYRYKYFVDTSPRGRNCRYASACVKLYYMDKEYETLLEFLEGLVPAPPSLPRLREILNENQDPI